MADLKSLKAKKFFPMLSDRQKRFDAAEAKFPAFSDNATALAKALHPKRQYLKVAEVVKRSKDCRSYTLVPDEERGTTQLAYFGAGKYLTVFETIEGMPVSRGYSISSSPKDSLEGKYVLTIKLVKGGLMSKYIFDTWKVGTQVTVSAPAGNFEYQPLRDAKKVICIAGGSGITPFISMANAIADGDEDFEMTLLYGSRNIDNILFKVIFLFRNNICHSAVCNSCTYRNVTCVSAHNFNNTATFVAACCISETVTHFNSCVKCCIVADSVVTAGDIVIDCAWDTNSFDTFS